MESVGVVESVEVGVETIETKVTRSCCPGQDGFPRSRRCYEPESATAGTSEESMLNWCKDLFYSIVPKHTIFTSPG
jgi:hypothetical protein